MTSVLSYAPIAAAAFGIPQFVPQVRRLLATRDTAGLSWSWAALTAVSNAAWIAYFAWSRYWLALVPSCSVTLLAAGLTALVAVRERPARRAVVTVSAWAAALAGTGVAGGRDGLGAVLAVAFAVQVAPSLQAAYRTARPTGVSAGTWWLILGELACFLAYGFYEADPRLIALGATGVSASALMLARLGWTRGGNPRRNATVRDDPSQQPDRVLNFLTMRSDKSEPARTFIEQARRRQLVGAAIEQLAEAGYAGTTLATIAARAGLSKPAVLYHFTGGKDELLVELVDTVLGEATAAMTEAIKAEATLPAMLRAYITANVAFLAANRREILAVLAVFNGSGPRPDGSSPWEPRNERVVAELAGLLHAGQQAGVFGAFAPMVVARTLRGAIDALEPVLRHHPEVDLDAYAAELVAIFEKVTAP